MAKGLSGWRLTYADPVVIYGQDVRYAAKGQDARSRPAKAGIQESGGAVMNSVLVCRLARSAVVPVIVLPAVRAGMIKPTGFRPSPA